MKLTIVCLTLITLIGIAPSAQAQDILVDLQRDTFNLIDGQLANSRGYGYRPYPYSYGGYYGSYSRSTAGRIIEDTIRDARHEIMREREHRRHERTERRRAQERLRECHECYGSNRPEREVVREVIRTEPEPPKREALVVQPVTLTAEDVICNEKNHPTFNRNRVRIVNPTPDMTFRLSGGIYSGENQISLGPGADMCPLRQSNGKDLGFTIIYSHVGEDGALKRCKAHLEGFTETDTAHIVPPPGDCEVAG